MWGQAHRPTWSVRKIFVSPLQPIGGTGQGVPEFNSGALFPEQRRSTGDSCVPAGNLGPGSYDTERQAGAPMTPLGALADRGFADVEHVFNCSVWGSDGATVALALRAAEFL